MSLPIAAIAKAMAQLALVTTAINQASGKLRELIETFKKPVRARKSSWMV